MEDKLSGLKITVINGITDAIPITSNKDWIIKKKISKLNLNLSFLLKKFQRILKFFINNMRLVI
tara:strand:+ start:48 stop:239 length:192 start_codon:yes stop_codon:yes gene_type:complete